MLWWELALILVGLGVGLFLLIMGLLFGMVALAERIRRCPECGARGLKPMGGIMSTRPPGGEFDLYRCPACETWFKQPVPYKNNELMKITGEALESAKRNAGVESK